jgi:UDP-N-acetylglucosamine 3-dehydrogenase
MQDVGLAIVGAGEFGARYIDSLRGVSGARVAWVCDRHPERAEKLAAASPAARATTDLDEVCADPDVDAVIVVTPEGAHRAVTETALRAGKHAIVEKPLATSEEDGLAMIAAAEEAGKLLMTSFLLRFDYRYARLQQQLQNLGPVRNIYAYRNFDRSLFALYSRTHSLIENAIHDIDLILWYVQSKVVRAHGFCRNTLGRENPDVNWGMLEFENGALAALQTSWLFPPQAHETLQWNAGIQVMCDRGVVEVRNDADGFRASTEDLGQVVLDQSGWASIHGEPRGAFGAMLRHFVQCLRGEAEYCGTPPAQALESMRAALMLVQSANQNRPIDDANYDPTAADGTTPPHRPQAS